MKEKAQSKHGGKRRKGNSLCFDNRDPMRAEFYFPFHYKLERQDCERDKNLSDTLDEFKKNGFQRTTVLYYTLYYFSPKV